MPEMQIALDTLVSAPMSGSEVNDLTARLKRALNAEMSLHLGYAPDACTGPMNPFSFRVPPHREKPD